MVYHVATFYRFFAFPDYADRRESWRSYGEERGIKGTILLAAEGINGTLAGDRDPLEAFLAQIRSELPQLADLAVRWSRVEVMPFGRLKVKLKREIVTLGQPEANPQERVGTYVKPEDWNQLLADPEVVVIDTRNDYEVAIGSFAGAVNPQTASFREFPDYVREQLSPQTHPKVALFCTGGIRCEKATAHLLNQGFAAVYHLQGGILNYLQQVSPEESQWQGECFVFDERVALKQGLEPGSYGMCQACGRPVPLDCLEEPLETGVDGGGRPATGLTEDAGEAGPRGCLVCGQGG